VPLRWPSLRLWRELALVLLGYWIYTAVRNAVPDHVSAAEHHADQIYRLEQWLGIDIELAVNQGIDRITWFIVTIGVLVWLYRSHPHHYRRARTVFLLTNAAALLVFYLYPLAPPRLLPELGYIDTVVSHGTWGSWASGDVAAATNQYAAMPSMHVAWSLWSAIAIALLARRQWVRVLALAHPLATLVVIVATGNHFLLDAVGGVMALGTGYAVPWLVIAVYERRPRRKAPALAAPAEHPPDRVLDRVGSGGS
jgi:hypothetical protein